MGKKENKKNLKKFKTLNSEKTETKYLIQREHLNIWGMQHYNFKGGFIPAQYCPFNKFLTTPKLTEANTVRDSVPVDSSGWDGGSESVSW